VGGAEEDGGEDQRRHFVAAHQGVAAVWAALGVDWNANLVQHRDIALKRTHRDIQRLGQLRGVLVGLALEQHDQGNQSGCGIGHELLPGWPSECSTCLFYRQNTSIPDVIILQFLS
jgi:hypothetical protein